MRTNDEINAEIAALTAMKPKVRRHAHFGDDNHAAIEAQIRALTERFDDDDIWDEWPEEEDEEECRERDCARDAVNWMTGDVDDAPSKDWADLVTE